jgi:hypothetical protein
MPKRIIQCQKQKSGTRVTGGEQKQTSAHQVYSDRRREYILNMSSFQKTMSCVPHVSVTCECINNQCSTKHFPHMIYPGTKTHTDHKPVHQVKSQIHCHGCKNLPHKPTHHSADHGAEKTSHVVVTKDLSHMQYV